MPKNTVNVIMPVYNEERTLAEVIKRVLAQNIVDRLIIIDDCSADGSLGIIKSLARKDKRITYVVNSSNSGKGFSVRKGLSMVKEGIIIIQDADLEYYPEDYDSLIKKMRNKGKDTFVLGIRVDIGKGDYLFRLGRFVNSLLTSEFNLLYGKSIKDTNTCYKVFRKEMLSGIKLKESGFLIDPEILINLIKKGYKPEQVPIRYKGRSFKEGKKITAKDAIDQAVFLLSKKL